MVLYKKGDKEGTLNAEYCHSVDGKGNGIAHGNSKEGFEGEYQIQYFDDKGSLQAERDLEIQKKGDCFYLTWSKNGSITSTGIGFENAEGLLVGYHDV